MDGPTLYGSHTHLFDDAIAVTTDSLTVACAPWEASCPILEQTGAAGSQLSQFQVSCLFLCLTQGTTIAACCTH